ncbi:asparagine-linked glycosylation protein [Coemansia brasiliensis]|uniref:GDP-Man:Man(3)GlcNAc(2)-PP-Dol alpha-1,2-mannosyltransferase n=1 Tax=Coemansia brasiliensis TaxID=2650707 RepID=A0A9W8M1D7_9FUNG|nr:asparagine-linked glycosylation protein [Coemansia brasiliensis]
MPSLQTFIHYSFAIGVVLAVPVVLTLIIQFIVLGTVSHQNACKQKIASSTKPSPNHRTYYAGFFHPYPNAGGGGERVLWTMIKAIQDKYPFIISVIYSGDNINRDTLVRNVKAKFGLNINPDTVYIVDLKWRSWVDHKYPRLTLVMQSIGSLMLAAEAIHQFVPDIFIDTVGYAFTYPLVNLLSSNIPIVAYTHYPTISSDMQTMVSSRESGFNNDPRIAASPTLTNLKSIYYRVLAHAYAFSGSFADMVMTNSSWTYGHIVKLFDLPRMTSVVYPPCDTAALTEFSMNNRQNVIMSLAQFRPEKNHSLQLEAFAKFLKEYPQYKAPGSKAKPATEDILQLLEGSKEVESIDYPLLVMIGGARNIEDEARAESLRQLASSLGVNNQVYVIVNAPWSQVQLWLKHSSVGIHTMRDEHFGINIVEMMAAGLLTIAHDSAGPKLDIISPAIRINENALPSEAQAQAYLKAPEENKDFPVGMVATTTDEFAQMIACSINVKGPVEKALRSAARAAATTKFSEAAFSTAFYRRFNPVVRWLDSQNPDS